MFHERDAPFRDSVFVFIISEICRRINMYRLKKYPSHDISAYRWISGINQIPAHTETPPGAVFPTIPGGDFGFSSE